MKIFRPPGFPPSSAERLLMVHTHEVELLAHALEAEAAKGMRAGQGELHDMIECRAVWFRKALEQ